MDLLLLGKEIKEAAKICEQIEAAKITDDYPANLFD